MSAIVYAPEVARFGFRVVVDGAVRAAADLDDVAVLFAAAYADDLGFDARARVTLTRERPLTAGETAYLVARATELVR